MRKVSWREAIQALERLGFRKARQRGSQVLMVRETSQGKTGCALPMHREIKVGTLQGILRLAKIGVEEFTEAL